jgi:hypothetical protein
MATAFDRALAVFIRKCPYVIAVHDLTTKWRIELTADYLLDVFYNEALGKYSYTLVQGGKRVIGWDNAPHHPTVLNFPHHVHQQDGPIAPSPLTGEPEHDLEMVRHIIEALLS